MFTRMIASLAAVLLLSGCARDAVLFATSSTLGIELNAADNAQQTVKVGYQRIEGVIMPVGEETAPTGASAQAHPYRSFFANCPVTRWFVRAPGDRRLLPEAYSVLSRSEIDTGSLLLGGLDRGTEVRAIFATGAAARQEGAWETARAAFAPVPTTEERAPAKELLGLVSQAAKDAKDKAREERYRNAIVLAMKNLETLQYTAEPARVANGRIPVTGAIRIREDDLRIRIDSTQHSMDAMRKIIAVW